MTVYTPDETQARLNALLVIEAKRLLRDRTPANALNEPSSSWILYVEPLPNLPVFANSRWECYHDGYSAVVRFEIPRALRHPAMPARYASYRFRGPYRMPVLRRLIKTNAIVESWFALTGRKR